MKQTDKIEKPNSMKRPNGGLKPMVSIELALLLLTILGCQKGSSFNPPNSDAKKVRGKDLQLLKSQQPGLKKEFVATNRITRVAGGTILLGDDIPGYSDLTFLPGSRSTMHRNGRRYAATTGAVRLLWFWISHLLLDS
jgi:hypothetical protein